MPTFIYEHMVKWLVALFLSRGNSEVFYDFSNTHRHYHNINFFFLLEFYVKFSISQEIDLLDFMNSYLACQTALSKRKWIIQSRTCEYTSGHFCGRPKMFI